MAQLEVTDLVAGYGEVAVLHGISFEIEQGETAVFLGMNGAGKTTTMLCLAGLLQPSGGQIRFEDEDCTAEGSKRVVARGIVLVPEGRRVFPGLSVDRNLQIGAWVKRKDHGFISQQREQVFEYFPRLRERREQLAGTLSGGEQQMLAISRGLMADPKVLLIDEASLGLAPVIVQDVFSIIQQINETGVTVILVEQNISALDIADRAFVIEKGTLVYAAEGEEVRKKEALREAYLGTPA